MEESHSTWSRVNEHDVWQKLNIYGNTLKQLQAVPQDTEFIVGYHNMTK